MKLLLLKCAICDYWHNPAIHNYHCPHCGAFALTLKPRVRKYYRLDCMRLIEVVRSIPRSVESSINCR